MKKRVLHIAEAPGGVERFLITLLTKLKNNPDWEHILVCSSTFDCSKFVDLVNQTIIIDSMHNKIDISADLQAIISVRKIIKQCKPDLVYCHSSKAGAIGRLANIGIKNKLVYNAHGWAFNMKDSSNVKKTFYTIVEKMLAHMTEKIICISEYEKESALDHRICKEDKLVVINNGINFDEFDHLHLKTREELKIPDNAFVIGTIGRISKQKAPDIFVKMAVEVKKQIPEAFFIMVGDDIGGGGFRTDTENAIDVVGLKESFLITGWVDNPIDYLEVFDVAVLLSRWEGFGLVLPEYMKMGKPIIATKADAIPYVVDDAGILIDIDDYKQAAESVVRMRYNEKFRSRILEKEKERVNLFNAERTAKEHVELFGTI